MCWLVALDPLVKFYLIFLWYTDDANVCVSVAMQQPLHSQRDAVSDRYRRLTPAVGGAPGPVVEETQTGRGHKQGSHGLLPESLEDSPEMSWPLHCRICLAFLHHPWGASTCVCVCMRAHTIYVTLDHKTSHKGKFFETEIYTWSESWINKLSTDVWFVRIFGWDTTIWKSGIWGCKKKI